MLKVDFKANDVLEVDFFKANDVLEVDFKANDLLKVDFKANDVLVVDFMVEVNTGLHCFGWFVVSCRLQYLYICTSRKRLLKRNPGI